MNRRTIRFVLSLAVVAATAYMFVSYLRVHPDYLAQLRQTNPWWIVGIIVVNFAAITVLAALLQILIRMTGKRIDTAENWLLTIYSSIANFFGPLQSGPGVRAAYLKTKHTVSLQAYLMATLLAYAVYAVISAFCLLIGTLLWWQVVLGCLVVIGVSTLVFRWIGRHRQENKTTRLILTPSLICGLIVLTALQIILIGLRYYLALAASGTYISLGQIVSYTGAANFSLFVSLTPDGIGIREAFLLFSQQIHHVPTHAIVTANIIDRATYIVFLALLFLIALSLHAKNRFNLAKVQDNTNKSTLH